MIQNSIWIRDSAVGIATGYGLDGRGVGIQAPVGARFFPRHIFHISTGVPGAPSPEVKGPGRVADHSPPTSAEVKNTWIYESATPFVFMS
jgi:hypothetical protein